MLIKFTYPVAGWLALSEQWPVRAGPYALEWQVEEGLVRSVSATKKVEAEDTLPTVTKPDEAGIALHIHAGEIPSNTRLESDLRLIQGILSLFAPIAIDFRRMQTDWIAETPEEEQKIQLHSISADEDRSHLDQPLHLEFEYVARAAAAIEDARHLEVPLSFLRRGHEFILQQRYIEGFYNLFFYFETQFAGGYSNPKEVKKRLLLADAVREGLKTLRESPLAVGQKADAFLAAKLELSDDEIIGHLVKLRGELHHHAAGRPAWHPEKADDFRSETLLLDALASRTALAQLTPIMFSPTLQDGMLQQAQVVTFRAVVQLKCDKGTSEQVVRIRTPGAKLQRRMIPKVAEDLLDHLSCQPGGSDVVSYQIYLEGTNDLLATYQRFQTA